MKKEECPFCRGEGKVVYDHGMMRPPKIGERLKFSCPNCNGRGWELKDDSVDYRDGIRLR